MTASTAAAQPQSPPYDFAPASLTELPQWGIWCFDKEQEQDPASGRF
jgi:hypothetical protein